MKEYIIAICECDKYETKIIEKNLKKILDEKNIVIKKFKSLEELLKDNLYNIDVFIIDIMFGKSNGIQVAKKIRDLNIDSKIIFIAENLNFAKYGYEVNAYRYVIKPINFEELREIIINCILDIDKLITEYIFVNKKNRVEKIKIYNIEYIEVVKKNIIIHTLDQEIEFTGTSIEKIEKNLKEKNFFRCHKSYIVNLERIDTITQNEIIINKKNIPLSRYRRNDLKKEFIKLFEYKI